MAVATAARPIELILKRFSEFVKFVFGLARFEFLPAHSFAPMLFHSEPYTAPQLGANRGRLTIVPLFGIDYPFGVLGFEAG